MNRFRSLLEANNCDIEKLHSELETVFDHVNLFLPNVSPSKVWRNLFTKQKELNIDNIHVEEICIAIPLSNAEMECVFSFLWKVFAKERRSLKNQALENTLILRCDTNTSPERYSHAIDLFLSEKHPDEHMDIKSDMPKFAARITPHSDLLHLLLSKLYQARRIKMKINEPQMSRNSLAMIGHHPTKTFDF